MYQSKFVWLLFYQLALARVVCKHEQYVALIT
jgi:hypothetical protein